MLYDLCCLQHLFSCHYYLKPAFKVSVIGTRNNLQTKMVVINKRKSVQKASTWCSQASALSCRTYPGEDNVSQGVLMVEPPHQSSPWVVIPSNCNLDFWVNFMTWSWGFGLWWVRLYCKESSKLLRDYIILKSKEVWNCISSDDIDYVWGF